MFSPIFGRNWIFPIRRKWTPDSAFKTSKARPFRSILFFSIWGWCGVPEKVIFSDKHKVFILRCSEQTELVNVGCQSSTKSILGTSRPLIGYSLECHIWKWYRWRSFHWKQKFHRVDQQASASRILLFQASGKQPRRDILTEWCSTSLFFYYAPLFICKTLKPLDSEGGPVAWPLRSPDVTSFYFFSRAILKIGSSITLLLLIPS